ncbi:peptidoglycan-binding protein [Pseudochelatococcus sp. G4_1912]|uniref:peptidoglycan-binding protein n=1 Tax=Pseudochelatococcus sp. G4_1912 TaxID=3114288 RepID=UPI0039C6C88A
MLKKPILLGSLFCVSATNTMAQGPDIFGGIIGGIMAAAQAQAAQDAWARESPTHRYCLQKLLSRDGVDFRRLIQAGVEPSARQLSHLHQECAKLNPSNLKSGIRCTVPDSSGREVPSVCNQRFARATGESTPTPMDTEEAVNYYARGGKVIIAEIENDAGKRARREKAETASYLAGLTVLKTEIEPYRSSQSEHVRNFTQSLVKRISAASSAPTISRDTYERIRQDITQLKYFESAELMRLAALEKLASFKAEIEKRPIDNNFTDELDILKKEYLSLTNQPAMKPDANTAVKTGTILQGPTFDCKKASTAFEKTVCSSPELRQLDIEIFQPYYILRYAYPAERESLRQEAIDHAKNLVQSCNLGSSKQLAEKQQKAAINCLSSLYRTQRDTWRERIMRELPQDVYDEVSRSPAEHIRLQEMLQRAGYIDTNETIDGIYGINTRNAILSLQASADLPQSGYMTRETEKALLQKHAGKEQPVKFTEKDSTIIRKIADPHSRYTALEARIDEFNQGKNRKELALARIDDARRFLHDIEGMTLSPDMQAKVAKLSEIVDAVQPDDDGSNLVQATEAISALRTDIENVTIVTKATTDKNKFLIDGELDDIILLYNSSASAPSVVKNLRGILFLKAPRPKHAKSARINLNVSNLKL